MRYQHMLGAAVAALALPSAAYAQQITSGIEGIVRDKDGATIAAATITINDVRTGNRRTLIANGNGGFRADNLVTGGPYNVIVSAPGFESQTFEDVTINLQGNTSLDFRLTAGTGDIIVSGSRVSVTQLAIGPGQSFGAEELRTFPSITRDIRDIIRLDPRVSLNRANEVDRISCLGGNDRSNSFTVDGINQNDVFGLNGTPFAGRNTLPLPFDTIRETSVEFAPFDVQYGQFTGCAINVVTKSGQNSFHGSGFFTYTANSLQGNRLDGVTIAVPTYERKRWGATLSGPILKDKLFFSFGYEETDLGDVQDDGPIGSGLANELPFIKTAQFNQISQILRDTYNIDPGPIATTLPETSRRFFGRLDWYITDRQRLEFSYQRLDEQNVEPDDFNNTQLTGLNTFELEGTTSNFYSARLYSNWTDNFSTEVRASRSEVQDVQGPVGGGEAQSANPIPRILVGVQNNGVIGRFLAGPGFSRTSNDLKTTINALKVKANLVAGNHRFSVGAEVNELEVFNLFGQNTTGTLVFNSIADLQAGLLSGGTSVGATATDVNNGVSAGAFGNFTASGNILDAAVNWRRTTYTVYGQDQWQVTPQLDVLLGLRVDWFDGNAPTANPSFLTRYGFSNAIPFSRLDPLALPRVGFTYKLENEGFFRSSQIKGGVGIFQGGDPTVFFSNAFTNNGFALGFGQTGATGCFPTTGARADVVVNNQFTGVPGCVRSAASVQARAGLADAQSILPDLDTPTVIRANLGFATEFGVGGGFFDNWRLNLDYIYSRFRNPLTFVDLAQVVDTRLGLNGFTIDGRPVYRAIDPSVAGCTAVLQNQGGSPVRYTNVNTACFNTQRDDEIQLANGRDFNSHVFSVILNKSFKRGLFTSGGGVNLNIGYAFTQAQNSRFNNGTTATGSIDGSAVFDFQDVAVATAEFETRHNITFGLNFRERFFGDFDTQLGLVFIAREGRPYSYVFNGAGRFTDSVTTPGQLLYVPTGPTDPNVTYASFTAGGVTQTAAQASAALDTFITNDDCLSRSRGRSISRNTCRNDWFKDLDLRISQELPGVGNFFGIKDRVRVYADFDNFLNLIDDGLNISRSRGTSLTLADGNVDAQGRYVYNNVRTSFNNFIGSTASLWRVQFGVSYSF